MIEFGTGGFRGVIAEDFTQQNVRLIAEALARIAEEEKKADIPVAVGYDNRFMSDFAADWICEVLAAHGMTALRMRYPTPTPAVMYTVKELGLSYGAMVTASHNPYYFNGVKLFTEGGMDADAEFTGRMENMISRLENARIGTVAVDIAKRKGLVRDFDNTEDYLGFIKSFISPKIMDNRVKILYDNIYGVGAGCLEKLAKDYHIARFDVLRGGHDAFFGFSLPNPTNEAMLSLAGKVKEGGYDFAMATDSDADRLGILDENGCVVDSNDILGALYYYLHRYRGMKGGAVKNCATSLLIDKIAEKFGEKCYEVDVGFKNVSQKMAETDALIGGESSGGLTVRGYVRGKDSVFSASLFTEMVVMMKKPVSEIIREVHEFAGYSLSSSQSVIELRSLDPVKEYLAENTPELSEKVVEKRCFGRNYKYILDDGWALLRMSGTEPVLRVFAETKSAAVTESIIRELTGELKKFA